MTHPCKCSHGPHGDVPEDDLAVKDVEVRRNLEMRVTGLTKAVGDMEPGAREFCLAAISEWLDYTDSLLDRLRRVEDQLREIQEVCL